jgi:hypothetical protein
MKMRKWRKHPRSRFPVLRKRMKRLNSRRRTMTSRKTLRTMRHPETPRYLLDQRHLEEAEEAPCPEVVAVLVVRREERLELQMKRTTNQPLMPARQRREAASEAVVVVDGQNTKLDYPDKPLLQQMTMGTCWKSSMMKLTCHRIRKGKTR